MLSPMWSFGDVAQVIAAMVGLQGVVAELVTCEPARLEWRGTKQKRS